MTCLRLSIGDFSAIDQSVSLPSILQNYLFWLLWLLSVFITCIIFLNFIVAEASASYSKVVETLEAVIFQQRSNLIDEAEQMTFQRFKTAKKYPSLLVVREIDT